MRLRTFVAQAGVCIALVLSLSGCFSFSDYESPTTGPTASIEFHYVGNDPMAGGAGIRRISIGEAEGCANRQWHPWRDVAKLSVGKPLYIIQGYDGVYGGGCDVAYRLTPKEGEKYISEFSYDSRRCQIRVLRSLPNGSKVMVPGAMPINGPNCWGT